ncbi:MAG: ribulose-phosphate 3-epimerase [Bacilli bacterium]|nr:ribulose-phosphate 3-epimerase [Bacilli bacterium]
MALKVKTPCLSPSLLACQKCGTEKGIAGAESIGAPFIHIDVMDGKFVKNVSFGVDFVKEVHDKHKMLNDTHIMVERPWELVEEFAKAGSDIITFHLEACDNHERVEETIKKIHDGGAFAGLCIRPGTPIDSIAPYINSIDLVLLMCVEPGWGGQKFIPETYERIKKTKKLIKENNPSVLLEVDGGINDVTGPKSIEAGADILVTGTYLFGDETPEIRASKILNR